MCFMLISSCPDEVANVLPWRLSLPGYRPTVWLRILWFSWRPGSKDSFELFRVLCSQKEAVVKTSTTFEVLSNSSLQGIASPTLSENSRLPHDFLVCLYTMPSLLPFLWNILVQNECSPNCNARRNPLLSDLAYFVLHTSFQPEVYFLILFSPSTWLKWG